MRTVAAAAIAVMFAGPVQAAEWWWIGLNGDAPKRVITYVDKETVRPLEGGALDVWTLAVGEAPLLNGQQHQATRYAIKCKKGTFATLGRIAYDAGGTKLPLADIPPSDFAPALPGSIGDSLVKFVCGKPSGMELQVPNAVQHAAKLLAGSGQSPASAAARPNGAEQPRMSVGTGFFIGSEGNILTSYHVIDGAQRVGCRTPNGQFHAATIVRVSPANDLALLRVNTRPKNYLTFAPRGSLHAGDRVFTVGYGAANYLGINEPRFTDGTVSALSGLAAEDSYMQISVPVQPGNSGGPLVNEDGQVVGVIAAQAAVDAFLKIEGTLPQNVNWAVKSDYATPLASAPPAPKRTRQEAIRVARESLCLIVAEG